MALRLLAASLLAPLLLATHPALAGNHPSPQAALEAARRNGKPVLLELGMAEKGEVLEGASSTDPKLSNLVKTRFETVRLSIERHGALAKRFGAVKNEGAVDVAFGSRGGLAERLPPDAGKLQEALEGILKRAPEDDAAFEERLGAFYKSKGKSEDPKGLFEECARRFQIEDARRIAKTWAKQGGSPEEADFAIARACIDWEDWAQASELLDPLSRKPAFEHRATLLLAEIRWGAKGEDAAIAFLRAYTQQKGKALSSTENAEINFLAERILMNRR